MTRKEAFLALATILVTSPALATQPEPRRMFAAPAGSPETKYCLRVEAITGSRIERVSCWTREEWAVQGVDVDKEWAEEGVKVVT